MFISDVEIKYRIYDNSTKARRGEMEVYCFNSLII